MLLKKRYLRKPRADGWRSPPCGYFPELTNIKFQLEFMVDCERGHAPDILGAILADLASYHGDHRVSASFSVSRPGVSHIIGPWTRGKLGHEHKDRLSIVGNSASLGMLNSVPWSHLSVYAVRGGGSSRTGVWDLHLNDQSKFGHGLCLELAIDLRFIDISDFAPMRALARRFFSLAPRHGKSISGWGNLAILPTWHDAVINLSHRWCPKDQFVSWVYPFMLLSAEHVKKLGGLPAFRERLRTLSPTLLTGGLFTQNFADGSIYLESSPDSNDLHHTLESSIYLEDAVPACAVLLTAFAERGLLSPTSDAWLAYSSADNLSRAARQPPRASAASAREAKKRVQQARQYLSAHPPRCAELCARPIPPSSSGRASRPASGTLYTRFALSRPGKGSATTVYGCPIPGSKNLSSPVLLGSPRVDRAFFAFDHAIDGWDGEFTPDVPTRRKLRQFACPSCGGFLFRCTAEFEYDELDQPFDDPQRESRKQDYFSWFTLAATCTSCGRTHEAASIECA